MPACEVGGAKGDLVTSSWRPAGSQVDPCFCIFLVLFLFYSLSILWGPSLFFLPFLCFCLCFFLCFFMILGERLQCRWNDYFSYELIRFHSELLLHQEGSECDHCAGKCSLPAGAALPAGAWGVASVLCSRRRGGGKTGRPLTLLGGPEELLGLAGHLCPEF